MMSPYSFKIQHWWVFFRRLVGDAWAPLFCSFVVLGCSKIPWRFLDGLIQMTSVIDRVNLSLLSDRELLLAWLLPQVFLSLLRIPSVGFLEDWNGWMPEYSLKIPWRFGWCSPLDPNFCDRSYDRVSRSPLSNRISLLVWVLPQVMWSLSRIPSAGLLEDWNDCML